MTTPATVPVREAVSSCRSRRSICWKNAAITPTAHTITMPVVGDQRSATTTAETAPSRPVPAITIRLPTGEASSSRSGQATAIIRLIIPTRPAISHGERPVVSETTAISRARAAPSGARSGAPMRPPVYVVGLGSSAAVDGSSACRVREPDRRLQ